MLFQQDAAKISSVVLDRELTLEEFVAVCRYDAKVSFSSAYEQRVRDSRTALERRLKERTPIYGVNTGFGGNVDCAIADEDLIQLQENILFSHACAVGEPLKREQVRAMLLRLIASVGQGYSAVRLELMELARDFLNLGITPYVPCEGTVGGLSYITYASMTLLGKGRILEEDGRIVPAADVLSRHGLKPLNLRPREGLGITSNMGPQVGLALLAIYDFTMAMRHEDLCSALVCEALRCTDKAFDSRLLELKGHPEMLETAQWMRSVLAGSQIMEEARDSKVQDAICIRIIPHLLGAFKSQIQQAYQVMMRELNGVIDNPVFLPDGTALMGSNWDSSYVAIYCDSLCVGAVNAAKMINTHMKRLVDAHVSGLPAYLVHEPGVNNGFMMVQYVTEGLSADIAQLSNPVTAFYTSTSAGQEGPNPLSDSAAKKACQVAEKLTILVSMTMLSTLQGLDFLDKKPSPVLQKIHDYVRQSVSFMSQDDMMYERTEAMLALVKSGELLRITEELVGPFSL